MEAHTHTQQQHMTIGIEKNQHFTINSNTFCLFLSRDTPHYSINPINRNTRYKEKEKKPLLLIIPCFTGG